MGILIAGCDNMNKKVWRDVSISCVLFLLFVFALSWWMQKYVPIQESTESVANIEDKKVVYLTFDDGPSLHTKEVLDILDTYKVKATFFVTGENPDYYDMIFEEFKRGNAIGIHTFSHDYGKIYASEKAYLEDMDKMNALIKKQIGHRVTVMRFPGGASNTVSRNYQSGIMTSLVKAINDRGYQYYDWNASNGDGDCYKDSSTLVETAIREIGEQTNVMLLMHDGSGNKATVEALPQIIEALQQRGYEFRIIDSSTPVFHHHIAN